LKRFVTIARFSGRSIAAVIGVCLSLGVPAACLGAQLPAPRARAAEAPATCAQLTDRLLDTTGYSAALRGATKISQMEFQSGLEGISNLSDAERSKVDAAFARAFDPARLRANVRSHLVARCDAPTYQAVLAELASPLARRMRMLEDASGTKAGAEALRAYFDQMREHPPSQERVELIERLETSRHEVDFLENLMMVMARETAAGFGEPAPSDTDIRASMQNYMPMAKQMILMRGLGVYRDARDKDLVRYTAMWLSPSFQRFSRTLAGAFDAAFGTGVREAAQAVRPFLKRDGGESSH
jgi:hypothetical protein